MVSHSHIYLVQHLLEASAKRLPDKVALVCGERRLTYSEINEKADRLAVALLGMGIKRQDRVAIFMDNSAESVIAIFGILKAGAIFVNINAAMKARKINYVLNHAGAGALITHRNKYRIIKDSLGNLPDLHSVIWVEEIPGKIETEKAVNIASWDKIVSKMRATEYGANTSNIDLDLAAIVYTSGSTGEPKGVMCAHYNVVSVARSVSCYLENNVEDIVLCALPLSFGYGLYQVMAAFITGGTVVLEKSFAYPYRTLERMVAEKVTGFALVPTMAAILLKMEGIADLDLSSLRYITNAAAALPVGHIRKLKELWPTTDIFSMYGLTECVRVSYLPPDMVNTRPDSVGIPMPNEEVWIVDTEGVKLGPNQIGELVVRGSNVMQGYWNDPKESAMRFKGDPDRRGRLLYTGDLFRRDDDGYLYFVARKDDLIKTKGERVSPKEIENCLCELEIVKETVVIGVPDEILGQAIKAFVVTNCKSDSQEKKLMQHCQKNLEPYMVPKFIEFLESLPKLANGKVDKKKLKGRVD